MPAVQMFRSKSGATFETEFEEHRDDLRTMIAKMVDNEPLAKLLTDKLTNGQFEAFASTVKAMYDCRPNAPQASVIS